MLMGFTDLADLPEDDRIRIIADAAMTGATVGFIVDDAPKADRYIQKLGAYRVRIIDLGPGPVPGSVLVRVGPIGH